MLDGNQRLFCGIVDTSPYSGHDLGAKQLFAYELSSYPGDSDGHLG